MNDKYSSLAKKILLQMELIAKENGSYKVGSEHLLLAFLKNEESSFSIELKKYGVTFSKASLKIKKMGFKEKGYAPFEYSEELKRTLEEAEEFSLRSEEAFISLESLFISLIQCDNNAYEVLSLFDINFDLLVRNIVKNKAKKTELDNIVDLHIMGIGNKDPLIGRESELHQLVNALSRRNKPNAVLVGEPGVGKTAIVEELASLIYKGEVPSLKGKRIYELDMASTVSGTKYRGEFEEKLKKIIKKTKDDGHAILFIDEIHTIVKAGGAEGAIDASNILKPYLARGEIQVIGATTEDEFASTFEKDKALKRRFQIIKIEESTCEETREILRRIKEIYENHYQVSIEDKELDYIVEVCNKYLLNEKFPDKAIDVLDNSLVRAKEKLTRNDIDNTLKRFYGIVMEMQSKKERMMCEMQEELIGQDEVREKISDYFSCIEKGYIDSNKPLGTLLFYGPSGVGKTLCSKIIGKNYFEENHIFSLDLSSYCDYSSLNRILFSSLSSEEASPFVKFMKTKPNSLIILESFEKSSYEVINFFFHIFDEGYFFDGKGNKISCTNALFILISTKEENQVNKFSEVIKKVEKNEEKNKKEIIKAIRKDILKRMDDVIFFSYLNKEEICRIIQKKYMCDKQDLAFEIGKIDHFEDEIKLNGARAISKKVIKRIMEREIKN
ncbi:MAG: AAA family ATPase [Bacilli bacterium]